jgi:hypothetical protein
MMIRGVLLLAHDPRMLAEPYERVLGWQLGYIPDERAHMSSCITGT